LRQLDEPMKSSEAYLFKPAPAYRLRQSTHSDTPIQPDEPLGENPPDGAILDYFLVQPASGPITLEIVDSHGKLARRYSSVDKPDLTQVELDKQLIPTYWVRMPKTLSGAAGMHRWVWDLRYSAPDSLQHQYPIQAVPHDTPRTPLGPLALPGEYTARLIVNGHTFTAPLTVKLDPRVTAPSAALEQQFNLEMQLSSALTRSTQALQQARSVRDQLHKTETQASGPLAESIKALDAKLKSILEGSKADSGAEPEPTLPAQNEAAGTLYGGVGQSDAAPTAAQLTASTDVETKLSALLTRWEEIRKTDLPALNSQLRNMHVSEISLEAAPLADDVQSDVE